MIRKKKGQIGIREIMGIILVALVVVSVLAFLFRSRINEYLHALPEFSVSEEDSRVVVDGEGEEVEFVKQVAAEVKYDREKVEWSLEFKSMKEGDVQKKLEVEEKVIEIPRAWWLRNKVFADITSGGIIKIRSKYYVEGKGVTNEYHKYRKEFRVPSVEDMRGVNGGKIINNQIWITEELKPISELYKNSLILGLVFDKSKNDEVLVRWSFEDKMPEVIVRPNGNLLEDVEGNEIWWTKSDFYYKRKYSSKIYAKIKGDIHAEDLILIEEILASETPGELSVNIKYVINLKRASFGNYDWYGASYSEINDYLYGQSKAPEIEK